MLVLEENTTFTQDTHIRPLNLHRDLFQVADLIQICFADQMDADGKEYLRQLRRVANDSRYLSWTDRLSEIAATPLQGFVWEEQGKIIGNLSLVPLRRKNRRVYLIANVAVHPDYRNQGHARALTQTAINYCRSRGAWMASLQVREENAAAHHLYETLGFNEVARLTTWQNRLGTTPKRIQIGTTVTPRYSEDWALQSEWLSAVYPEEVSWNLPIRKEKIKPGFFNELASYLSGEHGHNWSARDQRDLIGVLTWLPARSYTDSLWLATTPEYEEKCIYTLLPHVQRHFRNARPMVLNFPAGRAVDALRTARFVDNYTLIWMDLELNEF